MNLPNKLTLIRIAMIPAFAALYLIGAIPFNFVISAVIFALAAFTDFLDGYIARKHKLVTNLGKFLDPIADKVLVSTALVLMLVAPFGVGETAVMPTYCAISVVIILARELIVSGFRIVAASKGLVLAADKSGKLKTVFQDVAIVILLVGADVMPGTYSVIGIIGLVVLAIATLLTLTSGIEYLVKNRAVLKG